MVECTGLENQRTETYQGFESLLLRIGGLAQMARALDLHSRGHRFDSDILHKLKITMELKYILKDIPYLKLDVDFNLDLLIEECYTITSNFDLKPYESKFRFIRKKYSKAWSGISLASSDGELYTDLSEINETDNETYKDTKLKYVVPYMYNCIDKLNGGRPDTRIRLMAINPKKSLVWHSHVQEHNQPLDIVTVQIPIIVPDEFYYCTVDWREFKWYKRFFKPERFKTLQKFELEPGNAYYFNSYHYHNVYNNSNTESRFSLMLYLDLKNKFVQNLFKQSLNL